MDLTSDCALGDRRGTFRLLHSATAYGTGQAASWAIAPGSGTGELRTIRGQLQILDQHDESLKVPGFVSTMVYRMDRDPNELYMAVAFTDKESYTANARDPKQDERYKKMSAFLAEAPEWHDGEIIGSNSG